MHPLNTQVSPPPPPGLPQDLRGKIEIKLLIQGRWTSSCSHEDDLLHTCQLIWYEQYSPDTEYPTANLLVLDETPDITLRLVQ